MLCDTSHEKRDLKVFVVVIPNDYKIILYCVHKLNSEFGVISKEGLAQQSIPSLGITTTTTLMSVFA